MSHQNSSVINLRKCYRAKNEKAIINGNRNAIFLPGVGRYKGTWKNNVRDGMLNSSTRFIESSNRYISGMYAK